MTWFNTVNLTSSLNKICGTTESTMTALIYTVNHNSRHSIFIAMNESFQGAGQVPHLVRIRRLMNHVIAYLEISKVSNMTVKDLRTNLQIFTGVVQPHMLYDCVVVSEHHTADLHDRDQNEPHKYFPKKFKPDHCQHCHSIFGN